MKYRALIVEDEELSRKRLIRMLAAFPEDIEIVGEASTGLEAVEQVRNIVPDLLFLDIGLPGLDGFQVLANLDRQPAVIFTTASDQHALEAFKTYAVDYLVKPIDGDALRRSVEKLRRLGFNSGEFSIALERLATTLGNRYLNRLTCKVGDRYFLVKISDVLYFQSDSKYTSVRTSGKSYLIDTPLVDLEQKLNPQEFIRIHRGTIVNVSWIAEIRKGIDGRAKVVMQDPNGTELSASRMYSDSLKSI
jgi:two-component system, LytTR family, response regulator